MREKVSEMIRPHATWVVSAPYAGISGAVGSLLDADSLWKVNIVQAPGRVVFELRFAHTERGADPRAGLIEVRERPGRPGETEIEAAALRLSPLAAERDKINKRNEQYIGLVFNKLLARISAELEEAEGLSGGAPEKDTGTRSLNSLQALKNKFIELFKSDNENCTIIEMYFDGAESSEIGEKVYKTKGRIDNQLSEWRKLHNLPTRRQLRMLRQGKSLDP